MSGPVGGRFAGDYLRFQSFFTIFRVLRDWLVDGGWRKERRDRLGQIVRWAVRCHLVQGVTQFQDQSCVQLGLGPNLPQFSGPLRSSV